LDNSAKLDRPKKFLMRTLLCSLVAAGLLTPVCRAQLTVDQKLFDFEHLASIYAKYYAPYEWKRDLLGFDLYDIRPWLERVRATRSDLEYLEIASEYVASLRDSHSQFYIPSNFDARIGIGVDLYDDKVLIESINRTELPASSFPFQIGDEVLSIDGKSVEDLIREFSRFTTMANPRGTRRYAAGLLFFRPQYAIPRAHEIADDAVVVIRRANGELQTHSLPWRKRGSPITNLNAGPGPFSDSRRSSMARAYDPWTFLRKMQTKAVQPRGRIAGWGSRTPFFGLPDGFTQRLGRASGEFHYSGVYQAGEKRIGYLRIPNFSPPSVAAAERELTSEIAFLQENTDGLVVDITRNTGGGCYGETALQKLIPYRFRVVQDEIRPSLDLLSETEFALLSADAFGAEAWEIQLLQLYYDLMLQAYSENRGRTGPIPLCSPAGELDPVNAYSKPLIVLVDEFTVSWGDVFAAIMADAARGPLVGYRTDGAGGVVIGGSAGFYSESEASYSATLGTRKDALSLPDYPRTAYIENVGIHPDVTIDPMTRENLMTRFRPFVDGFTAAILTEIEKRK
jgi:C-terminal processing protease CtpA/Prc